MELAGNIFNPDDNKRLDEWRKRYSSARIEEDPSLPSNGFRTAGSVLFLASDFYKTCFGEGQPDSREPDARGQES